MVRTLTLLSLCLLTVPSRAAEETITITGGKIAQAQAVIRIPAPKLAPGATVALTGEDGKALIGQVTRDKEPELVTVIPLLPAGAKQKYTVGSPTTITPSFTFDDKKPLELSYDGVPFLRYMNLPLDESTKDTRFKTYKVYHHLFSPKGDVMVTNGPEGKFPHHRGLFFGFNRISYNGKSADVWHCNKGEFQSHDEVVKLDAGPVFATQVLSIGWHGQDKATFAQETRTITAYRTTGGTLLDWSTVVESKIDSPIKLDGDPQHAGFHFRANNEVETKNSKQTYYLRPDGKGKLGETRNWDPKGKNGQTVNLPWNAMSFMIGDKRYTLLRINHPSNPKETRGSERDYGRFGDYFEYTLTKESPLKLKYRVWLQEGELNVPMCEMLAEAFTAR